MNYIYLHENEEKILQKSIKKYRINYPASKPTKIGSKSSRQKNQPTSQKIF